MGIPFPCMSPFSCLTKDFYFQPLAGLLTSHRPRFIRVTFDPFLTDLFQPSCMTGGTSSKSCRICLGINPSPPVWSHSPGHVTPGKDAVSHVWCLCHPATAFSINHTWQPMLSWPLPVPGTSQGTGKGNYNSTVTWVLGIHGNSPYPNLPEHYHKVVLSSHTFLEQSSLKSKVVQVASITLHDLAPAFLSGMSSVIPSLSTHFSHTGLLTVPGSPTLVIHST